MEVNELIATEYAITPIIISTMQNPCSAGLLEVMSPYPTVVIVVMMKYKEARYYSSIGESSYPYL